ncbi:MAG: signal recognition particle receptor subunit alpha, partial [Candidatus Hydrogenedentes bacterium]|nr:signal recognition particle receptor subunit alpha [Candidatus Hydrogenedentota bacterium]
MSISGFMGRLREKLGKTRSSLVENVKRVFSGTSIDDSVYEELEEILIQADVGPELTLQIVTDLRQRARQKGLQTPQELYDVLKEELVSLLEPGDHTIRWSAP